MNTTAALVPVVALCVGFVAFCLVDIARHPVKLLPKWAWIVLCLASVPLGGVLYLVAGRDPDGGAAPAEPDAPTSGAAPPPTRSAEIPAVAAGLASLTTAVTEAIAAGDRPVGDGPARAAGDRPTSEPPAVTTSGLTKAYGSLTVLDHVDLSVPRGSVFGLVGPNGAGKTTLLSLLAGLRTPTSGSIELAAPAERVAVLPDTPSFDPWLTAREVVDLARVLVDPRLPASATDEALATVGLTGAADRRVGGFSRGMLQRLGLGATVVGEPELLLLDEPCSALDPLGRREVLDLVGRLGGERTVLFCSHILGDVQEVCDTVGVLRDGRLHYQGPLTELLIGRAAPAFTVRLRAPVEPVVTAVAAEAWVVAVEQQGAEELRVTVATLDDAERHLVPALAACGARVVSIVPLAGDLEHVFLEVTA